MDDELFLEDLLTEPEGFRKPDPQPQIVEHTRKTQHEDGTPNVVKLRLLGHHPLWGHMLWNASIDMANMIDSSEIDVKDKLVLELGAGAGLPSLIASLRGAKRVIVTDYPDEDLISNIQYNIDLNIPDNLKQNIIAKGHLWGKDINELIELAGGKFDVIICADIVFNHISHKAMLETIHACLAPTGIVHFTFSHHRPHKMAEDLNLFEMAEKSFGLVTKHIATRMYKPAFEVDYGPAEIRAQVHHKTLTWPQSQ